MADSKTILVTGSTDGIGLATARRLFVSGHTVLVHGRTEAKANFGVGQVLVYSGMKENARTDKLIPVWGDYSSLAEVVNLAKQVEKLNPTVLINNAGVYMKEKTLSSDGFEMTFAVNHLATQLLTHHLLPVLKQQIHSRVVTVSSIAHTRGHISFDNLNSEKHFDGYEAYAASKLMNVLFTRVSAALNKDSSVKFNCLHPGVIATKLLRAGFNIQGDGVDLGCQTSVFLATDPTVAQVTGKYFVNSKETIPSRTGQDDNLAIQLWKKTEEILKPWF